MGPEMGITMETMGMEMMDMGTMVMETTEMEPMGMGTTEMEMTVTEMGTTMVTMEMEVTVEMCNMDSLEKFLSPTSMATDTWIQGLPILEGTPTVMATLMVTRTVTLMVARTVTHMVIQSIGLCSSCGDLHRMVEQAMFSYRSGQ